MSSRFAWDDLSRLTVTRLSTPLELIDEALNSYSVGDAQARDPKGTSTGGQWSSGGGGGSGMVSPEVISNVGSDLRSRVQAIGFNEKPKQSDINLVNQYIPENGQIIVVTTQDSLGPILEQGMKTAKELNTSTRDSYTIEQRTKWEKTLFGDEAGNPIYGFMGGDEDKTGSTIDKLQEMGYGGAVLTLNESVKEKSTLTFGDSLNSNVGYYMPEHGLSDKQLGEVFRPSVPFPANDKTKAYEAFARSEWRTGATGKSMKSKFKLAYVEAQIWGGVSVSDIKSVEFRDKAPSAEIQSKLSSLNIPWSMKSNKVSDSVQVYSGVIHADSSQGQIAKHKDGAVLVEAGENEFGLKMAIAVFNGKRSEPMIVGAFLKFGGWEITDHFSDEQARAPKGTSIGGQWISQGGSASPAAGSREELKALVLAGASRDVIDSHVALLTVLREMENREETINKPGYGSQEWHNNRTYKIDGKEVKGTEAAVEAWETQAEELAWKETKRTVEPIEYDRKAIILLGPPAAGKSTIANEIAVARKAMILDSDEIKKSIPEFDRGRGSAAVHEESTELLKSVQALNMVKGANIIQAKIGDNPASIQKLISQYKEAGYKVMVVNMKVTIENAHRRNISRFVDIERIVHPEYLDSIGTKPSATYAFLRLNNMADGFAEIDNNGGFTDPKPILNRQGMNPLTGTRFAAQMD